MSEEDIKLVLTINEHHAHQVKTMIWCFLLPSVLHWRGRCPPARPSGGSRVCRVSLGRRISGSPPASGSYRCDEATP